MGSLRIMAVYCIFSVECVSEEIFNIFSSTPYLVKLWQKLKCPAFDVIIASSCVSILFSMCHFTFVLSCNNLRKWNVLQLKSYLRFCCGIMLVSYAVVFYSFLRATPGTAIAIAILSVHLSHGWIRQKRCKLGSSNLHHRLPQRL